jgi:hypothetical protein
MRYTWLFYPQRAATGRKNFKSFSFLPALCEYYYTLILAFFLILLTSCTAAQSLAPDQAQTIVADAWQTDQHGVWVLDWPAAPVGGPVTVETWRAKDSFRYEILEAVAPALIGEMLVFNGQTAWNYNRFDSAPPLVLDPPRLSPISDAFTVIDRLITTQPQSATQETVQTIHGPAQKVSLTYTNGDQLAVWQDDKTQLPVKVVFSVSGQQATLNARDFEPLVNPSDRLFTIP